MKNCNNCAWFCHMDGRCYGNAIRIEMTTTTTTDNYCKNWTFDGLGDEEREALMTVDVANEG